jgi:hypothetical protein
MSNGDIVDFGDSDEEIRLFTQPLKKINIGTIFSKGQLETLIANLEEALDYLDHFDTARATDCIISVQNFLQKYLDKFNE